MDISSIAFSAPVKWWKIKLTTDEKLKELLMIDVIIDRLITTFQKQNFIVLNNLMFCILKFPNISVKMAMKHPLSSSCLLCMGHPFNRFQIYCQVMSQLSKPWKVEIKQEDVLMFWYFIACSTDTELIAAEQ